ncbi:hypothetical protein DXG03_002642 [Asterophora parasitica]|uniref:Sfi1 spindle body domain-containing protein n=1 Tax=Asterophora parasitica TaxID=117018 RepID=A0A9P7G9R7_9AGAR|nr:hypothetical protein DXG03_002642 [Asterophora parasitica]
MSQFRPTRASPTKSARLLERTAYKVVADISRSSAASVPELSNLTCDEISLLDAVIDRAGPSATTFLTVFKAYNDVLSERGLDSHEVVYYGKLLKLGTMKGKNWGDKWSAVKAQYHQGSSFGGSVLNDLRHDHAQTENNVPKSVPRRNAQPRPPLPADDTFTLHSHADESSASSSTAEFTFTPSRPTQRRLRDRTPPPERPSNTIMEHTRDSLSTASMRTRALPSSQPQRRSRKTESSDSEDNHAPSTSTTPPSYRAATRSARPTSKASASRLLQSPVIGALTPAPVIAPATARKAVAIARERRGSVVNEEDAWNKIRMQRDEVEADQFRKDRLMERCWEVWKQGFQWILTTSEQIGEARDNLILRIHLQRWRAATASRRDLYERITTLAHDRCLRKAINVWRTRLREKEQDKWRQGMRQKMKTVREKRERTLRKDAWAKWRQSYRSHLSGKHYAENLVHHFYFCWKTRLSAIEELEDAADHAFQASQERVADKYWNQWRNARELRNSERIMAERIGLRLMGETMSIWQKRVRAQEIAAEFHHVLLMKTTIRSWKAAQDRIRIIENRADKHVARQDGVLLRAVSRVWKARERGKLLERVRASRLIMDSWSVWQQQIRQNKANNDLAIAFSLRSESDVAVSALRKWRAFRSSLQNAHAYAVQIDSTQLQYRMLLAWRIELRQKLKMVKMSRMAHKYFTTRRAWRIWHDALNARMREKRAEQFINRHLEKTFHCGCLRCINLF